MDSRSPMYGGETMQSEYAEAWSSDGDSVSTDSLSSDSQSSDNEQPNTAAISDNAVGAKYLRQAGIFTREEVVEQAIDRWTSYARLCGRALGMLRETMVDNYVKQAVEEKFNTENSSKNITTPLQQAGSINSRHAREARALRQFGRYSSKVENQRRIAAMSKFAIMSTRLAPWQKTGVSQQCKYRDPTTTTWERRCTRLCIPCLPFCSVHLVQSEVPVETVPGVSLEAEGQEGGGSGGMSYYHESGKTNKPMRKTSSARYRLAPTESSSGALTTGVCSGSKTGDTQLPSQYMFRKCGANGLMGECMEPVIAWSTSTRCSQHTQIDTIWPENEDDAETTVPAIDDKDSNSSQLLSLSTSELHPALVNFLRERRCNKRKEASSS